MAGQFFKGISLIETIIDFLAFSPERALASRRELIRNQPVRSSFSEDV